MMEDKEKELDTKKQMVDSIEVEEEPLEQEDGSTLTMEAPIVVVEPITLKSSSDKILEKIENSETVDELKEYTRLFHLSLAKKEASRALTQSDLLDTLLAQAKDRVMKRPGELSNKDILDYMNAMQTSLDKTSKTIDDKIENAPPVTLNQTNQEININIGDQAMAINEESRARILQVLNAITKNNNSNSKNIGSEKTNDTTKEGVKND